MEIDRYSPVPPWRQLAAILREQIDSGQIPPRRAIPSKKTLTQEYGIAGGTVDKAVQALKADGYLHTVHGLGLFVTDPADRAAAKQPQK